MKFCMIISSAAAVSDFDSIVARVNSLGTTWTAKVPPFADMKAVKQLLGTDMVEHQRLHSSLPQRKATAVEIPDEFDVRTNWPSCAVVTGDIRDQSACGSCWAHGAVESFNDRYCIATGSTALLSTEDALANSGAGSCDGGQPVSVLSWIKKTGIVSGGDYTDIGKGTTCAPYSLPTCQHHNWRPPTPEHPACPDKGYPTPKAFSSCKESGYATSFQQDKVKGGAPYSIKGEANIQSEIAQHGSVSAVLYVYDDLPAYESGVYQKSSGASFLGGHAVAMIGWGTENGTPYWLIKNSWNTDWGNKGLFKIKRGSNECQIESSISASLATADSELQADTKGDHHYEAPPCQDDEVAARLSGGGGALCAAQCGSDGSCSQDFPEDVQNPKPQCILQDQSGNKYCALTCGFRSGGDCPSGATCTSGVCAFNSTNALTTILEQQDAILSVESQISATVLV